VRAVAPSFVDPVSRTALLMAVGIDNDENKEAGPQYGQRHQDWMIPANIPNPSKKCFGIHHGIQGLPSFDRNGA
jgi:hypothetical protein